MYSSATIIIGVIKGRMAIRERQVAREGRGEVRTGFGGES